MPKKEEVLRRRKSSTKTQKEVEQKSIDKNDSDEKQSTQSQIDLQGATSFRRHRVWLRSVIILCLMALAYFSHKFKDRDTKLALVKDHLWLRVQKFPCAESYEAELKQFPGCLPSECARMVSDKLVDPMETDILLDMSDRLMSETASTASISRLDIHSGILSYADKTISIYKVSKLANKMHDRHFIIYNLVKTKIRELIADQYGIESSKLYLTHPTYISRITNVTAKSLRDEYWHQQVDKKTYSSFHFSTQLFLNTFNQDFTGGRFIFIDGEEHNRTSSIIEPKKGRIVIFTSGEENTYFVDKVANGVRYSMTISFTCDPKQSISDPKMITKQKAFKKK